MKENDFMILYVLFSGIVLGGTIYGAILSKGKTNSTDKQAPVESVYDARFRSFEYRGHRYLKYTDPVQAFNATLHDPDCPCWTNRLEMADKEKFPIDRL